MTGVDELVGTATKKQINFCVLGFVMEFHLLIFLKQ